MIIVRSLSEMAKFRLYLRGYTEPLTLRILRIMQIFCCVWIKFILFGIKVQGFLKEQVKKLFKEVDWDKFNEEYRVERVIPKVDAMPIFGTFFDLRRAGGAEQLHQYIDGRHYQYGDIFQENLGGSSEAYIFVSSASLMRSVFLYEGQYPRHPQPDAWKLYNKHFNCQRGLFFMDGEEWFHNRRILNRFLLNGNLNWMDEHIKASTNKLIREWKEQTAVLPSKSNYAIPDLEQRLFRWAVDVICTVMFGQIAISENPKMNEKLETFSEIVQKVFEKSTALMNFPPKLAKLLRLRIWKEFEENVEKVMRMGGEIIDMFVAINDIDEGDRGVNHDDAQESLFNMLENIGMPLKMIKRIFVDLVIAAGDTTAYTTVWALATVSYDNGLQRRLLTDINEHGEMSPLVRGLIKEMLRLFPVAPFIGRYLATDAVIEGYFIPKNTLVLLSLFTAGRDEKHFPQPYMVKPERWLRHPKTGEFANVLQAHGSLPFAIGNRSCIGRKLANKQMQYLLYQVIKNFRLIYRNRRILEPILRMVTVPEEPVKLEIKNREKNIT